MLIANPNRLLTALYVRNLIYHSIQDGMDTVHKARYVARKRAFRAQNLEAFALPLAFCLPLSAAVYCILIHLIIGFNLNESGDKDVSTR
ncbi:MAG: hypothetical protein CK426_01095 [Legionella sp.]|nr:MAG: hypothetical protein CK423_08360 [Legionella sp.]PJD99900.1 MAG: hypothetical protein CK426_01095 [Legionella sp.]